jgi:hypothetical protein
MVAPGRSVVILALVKLLLDLVVDAGDQRSSKTVGDFEQRSVENLKLLLCKGECDMVHYGW